LKSGNVWRTIRQPLELSLCKAAFFLIPKLPRRILVTLSDLLGWFVYQLPLREKKVALANLDLVFGDSKSASEKGQIARLAFQSFARTTLEAFWTPRLMKGESKPEEAFEFSPGSLELLENLMSRKRGLIAITFHYGNWEWLSLSWGMQGHPVAVVAQPIKNPGVEALFRQNREQLGHRLLHRKNAARHLFKALKRGEIIGLLVDLNSSLDEGGDYFEFFGVPVLTTRAVGHLAMRTGASVVCSIAVPLPDGRHRIEIGPEIPYDPAAELDMETNRITRSWLDHCEKVIRNQPEFWMWMYKRWKTRPTPDEGLFPYYSFYDPKCVRAAAQSAATTSPVARC
jgi:Kdo2-lipid IVA lauroyltransferase/acyltransferase